MTLLSLFETQPMTWITFIWVYDFDTGKGSSKLAGILFQEGDLEEGRKCGKQQDFHLAFRDCIASQCKFNILHCTYINVLRMTELHGATIPQDRLSYQILSLGAGYKYIT